MASRYWVGGSGNWSDDEHHWATSSGGSPGIGNLPTFEDDVFIDSNSGFGSGGTITLDDVSTCKDFTSSSGHTYTVDGVGYYIEIYGSFTLESGITWGMDYVDFYGAENHTITTAGVTLTLDYFEFYGIGTYTLQDDLTISGLIYQEYGTFNANNHNISASDYSFGGNVVMGSGTFTVTGSRWSSSFTITSGTSTIKFTNETSIERTFEGGDNSYNLIWFSGAGTGNIIIKGSNTFSELKIDTPPQTLKFEEEKTQTITTFTIAGTAGNAVVLDRYHPVVSSTGIAASGAYNAEGQSFIGDGGTLHSVKFRLKKEGSPTGNAVAIIYAHTGTYGVNGLPTGVALATSDAVDISGISTDWSTVTFTFSGAEKITLTDETEYFVVFSNPNGNGANLIYIEETADVHSGNDAVRNITTWGIGNGDVAFALYKDVGGNPVLLDSNISSDTAQFTLSKSSGIVSCDYLDISNSNATGGATWYAGSHSNDTTNNDGWLFGDVPNTTIGPFPTHFNI